MNLSDNYQTVESVGISRASATTASSSDNSNSINSIGSAAKHHHRSLVPSSVVELRSSPSYLSRLSFDSFHSLLSSVGPPLGHGVAGCTPPMAPPQNTSSRMSAFFLDSSAPSSSNSTSVYPTNTVKMRKLMAGSKQSGSSSSSSSQLQNQSQNNSQTRMMMVNSDSGLSMSSVLPSSSSTSSLIATAAATSAANFLSQQPLSMHLPQSTHLSSTLHQLHPAHPSSSTGSMSTAADSLWTSQQINKSASFSCTDPNLFVPMPLSASSLSSSSSHLHSLNSSSVNNANNNNVNSACPDFEADYGVISHSNNTNSANNGSLTIGYNKNPNLGCGIYELPSCLLNRGLSTSSTSSGATATATVASSTLYRSPSKSSYVSTSVSEPRSEYESLYKRYAELDSFHGEVVNKLSMAQAENIKQRKMYDDIFQQLNQALKEKASLQQQCTAAIRQWDKAIREIHELQDQLGKVKQQRDEANKECNNAMAGRSKAIRERQRMYEERNSALHEYNLIMSERDSVHKEIEKLQEDLHEIQNRNQTMEKEHKVTLEELESLRRELASALLDRDRAMKACNDLREKYGESVSLSGTVSSLHSPHSHQQQAPSLCSPTLPHGQQNSQQSIQQTLDSHYSSLFGHSADPSSGTGPSVVNNCSSSSNSSLLGVTNLAQSPTHLPFGGANYMSTSTSWHAKNLSAIRNATHHISTASSTSSVSTFGLPQINNPQQSTPLAAKTMTGDSNATAAASGPSPSEGQSAVQNSTLVTSNISEMDVLRKQSERLQLELQEAYQEVEVCKKRRDWAFSERDKIVLERESIRTLCDKLRRERDRKVSDLAEALRESDEIKRQKNEALKELKAVKEKLDSANKSSQAKAKDSSGAALGQTTATSATGTVAPTTNCTSQDSAIDIDDNIYCSFESEVIEIYLKRDSKDVDWGFKFSLDSSIRGGNETNKDLTAGDSNQPPIVVTSVLRNSVAAQTGGLRVYDQLLKINDIRVTDNESVELSKVQSLVDDLLQLNMQVRRRRLARTLHTISLPVLDSVSTDHLSIEEIIQRTFGFDAECVLVVNRVDSKDTAGLSVGDRIVSIDGTSVDTIVRGHLVQFMLRACEADNSQVVKVQVLKSSSITPTHSSLANHPQSFDTSTHVSSSISPSDSKNPLLALVDASGSKFNTRDCNDQSVLEQNMSDQDSIVATDNGVTLVTVENISTSKDNADCFRRSIIDPGTSTEGDLIDSEIEDDDDDRAVVDEDNDADEDEPDSDTEIDEAEVKTIAELDKVLDKYQIEDYYGSTVTNSSGCSLVPPPPQGANSGQQSQSTQAVLAHSKAANSDVYDSVINPSTKTLIDMSSPPVQALPQLPSTSSGLSTQSPDVNSAVVRRSNRLSKKNRQRCTLAASQLTEAAHELSLALASSNNNSGGAGDTWPRYRPHQLLSSVLPSFYKHHAHELQQIYSKQGKRDQLLNFDSANYITTMNRRKQRKSLGVFLDIFPSANLMAPTSTSSQATAVASSSSTTIDTATTSSTPSTRRSPRVGSQDVSHSYDHSPSHGSFALPANIPDQNAHSPLSTTANYSPNSSYEQPQATQPVPYHHLLHADTMHHHNQPSPTRVQSNQSEQELYLQQQHSRHQYTHHLESDAKMTTLSRNSAYNSIIKPNCANYTFGQPDVSASSAANYFYSSGQQQPPPPNNYSPIYSTYSSFRGQTKSAADGSGNKDSSNHASQISRHSTGSSSRSPQTDLFLYSNHSMPLGTTLVDYSVVSAQSQDKNVLKYYKTRQASGSSQSGSTGPTASSGNMLPLLVPFSTGTSTANPIIQQHQKQSRTRSMSQSYPTSEPSISVSVTSADIYSVAFGNDVYGQTRNKIQNPNTGNSLLNNDIYGNLRHSVPVTSGLSSANYYNLSSGSHLTTSLLSTASSGSGGVMPLSHLTNSNQAPPPSSLSHYPTLISSTMNPNASIVAPSNSNSNTINRLSANLNNLSLNITSVASLVPTRDSLMLSSGGVGSHSNAWDSEMASYASSVSSSTNNKTNKLGNSNTFLSIPAARLYRENFNHSSIYSPVYDSHLSSRTSISSSLASAPNQHQYSLSENIYGSVKRSTPPPPALPPPGQGQSYYCAGDEANIMVSNANFDDSLSQALNLIPSRSQRFRIPSNSSTVSTSKTSTKSACLSGLLSDKPGGTPPTYGSSVNTGTAGSNNTLMISTPTANTNIIGDRNSCSLMSTVGAPFEIKWIKCTKDGSPGSPILDSRKAKIDDYRLISIERSSALLGIRILRTTKSKGVFVQMVTEGSLAAQAGIKVGDQIIDICGINMRAADYENAAKVLNQCGDPIQMLVQYNYDKFKEIVSMHGDCERNISDLSHDASKCQSLESNESSMSDDIEDQVRLSMVGRGGESSVAHTENHNSNKTLDDNSRRMRHRDLTPTSSNSRHNTLTNEDVPGSAASTLTRRPKVASLPHECSLITNSPSSNIDSITSTLTTCQSILPLTSSFVVTPQSNLSHDTSSVMCSSAVYGHIQSSISPLTSMNNGSNNENSPVSSGNSDENIRRIVIEKTSSSLGISLIGGNAVGIFIHSIRDESLSAFGLSTGDQILEYNGVDLRHATAEEAAIELAKPADVVEVVVRHCMQRFLEIEQSNVGDSFYIKCAFDRPSIDGSLSFHKDDILYVDNTMFNGAPGLWRAWHVDPEGNKIKCGVVPSRYKAEEELMKRGGVYCDSSIGSGSLGSSTRRSFFRRRKTGSSDSSGAFNTIAGIAHFRSSSRDSTTKEIACYSDIMSLQSSSINGGLSDLLDSTNGENGNDAEPGHLQPTNNSSHENYLIPLTYIQVEKLSYDSPRPVLIVGPLKEVFIDKLVQDFPCYFQRCLPEELQLSSSWGQSCDSSTMSRTIGTVNQQVLDTWIKEKRVVDYRRRGSYVDVYSVSSVKKIGENNLHALLDVSLHSVERLHSCHIYPVVVFLKFKSTRQIKEINQYPNEKLSTKSAKEMYEHSLKIESEFKDVITVTIPYSNLSYMCTQVKACVDEQQNKALWL